MENDKETKVKLLVSAKKEFMEKGYIQASLRTICKEAGVTTGALYFFFHDKEDLFASLVEEPLNKLYEIMNYHYEEEITQAKDGITSKEDFSDDLEAAKQVIHYMYQHYDECQLILLKSQGSRFEYSIDKFVDITEKHYLVISDKISELTKREKVDDYIIHWMAHMLIDVFVHMLAHVESEEAALQHMESIIKYMVWGWFGMFR
ncbi:MAG: TetR/AcrR family transcriptional regulator [Velocimicrobium sp.]